MAGRIKPEDIALVKERSSLEDVVREHVTLRPAGPGSLKGLCPFHDEKTPSFNIRPAVGAFHCFGCGEGGDVIEFVMKVEHLPFSEAVERLAAKAGLELHYEDGPRRREESLGKRSRLIEAHRVAEEFYAAQLRAPGEPRAARDFLRGKGFNGEAADRFGVGYAPRGGTDLLAHLRDKGFTEQESIDAGLVRRSKHGRMYDVFQGRVLWPIRDITGDTVGFGARRLFDDDWQQGKYINTAETAIYKKTQVLYGLDLAKRDIARDRRAVVVEGYTDVMACQLSGVPYAVATCGTAFGADHVKLLRRILRDEADREPARVVFTFDGDEAGQKAAMKAFGEDQRWTSQSYVAVAPGGQDPCDLRQNAGEEAVRRLVEDAVPMFEFAVRTTIDRFDLERPEGRVQAMRAAAPIIAGIRDRSLRPEYTRSVAGWLGVEVPQLAHEVARAGRAPGRARGRERPSPEPGAGPEDAPVPAYPMPDFRDPVVALERQLLQVLLQHPASVSHEQWSALEPEGVSSPALRAVIDAVAAVGGPDVARSSAGWADTVAEAAPEAVRGLVRELAVAGIPATLDDVGRPDQRYVDSLVLRVQEVLLTRRVSDTMSALQRHADDEAAARSASVELTRLQRELAELRMRSG